MKLILASASPRRADLLSSAGLDFEIRPAEIDETPLPNEGAEELVQRLSREKALAVSTGFPGRPVLAADTVVVYADEIFGKPRDPEEARQMLRSLSGDTHEVMTAFTLCAPGTEPFTRLCITEVTFRVLTDAEIESYVAGGEPMDKAGAYGIQSGAAGFVSRIEGSFSNVVGLPLAEVIEALAVFTG